MMAPEHLPPSLEGSLAVVREWLDRITAASTNPELDLRNLRAVLIHLLEIVEQDSTIDAATDNLADAAANYLKAVERAPRMKTKVSLARRLNALELAFAALRRSLAQAKPRPGVLW
jgi:hypothetical protein